MSISTKNSSTSNTVYHANDGTEYPISSMAGAENVASELAANDVMTDVMFTMRSVPTEETLASKNS